MIIDHPRNSDRNCQISITEKTDFSKPLTRKMSSFLHDLIIDNLHHFMGGSNYTESK